MSATMTKSYWLHALSPLHVGAGRGLGHIDLPIAREKTTHWPYVPGSAVKGVLADHHGASDEASRKEETLKKLAFGLGGDDEAAAGALVFTDARLVCLPVQSFYGTFAWCASPLVLQNLKRDLEAAGMQTPALPGDRGSDSPWAALPETSLLAPKGKIYLQDLDCDASADEAATEWASFLGKKLFADDEEWKKIFAERFAIISNDLFDYLCVLGTQVDARIRIDGEKGTVATGGLWYEESLPAETILAGIVWCDGNRIGQKKAAELLERFASDQALIQVGGKATVGRGRVRLSFADETR